MPNVQSSDGVEIHYEIHGSGPIALIFLHGWGGGAETWIELVSRLNPARFRVICPDLRGHGNSGCPGEGYTWENFALDIFAIADCEQAHQFVPVGFSVGGKLACYLTTKQPARIPAQVLVAPVGPGIAPVEREFGLRICRNAGDWQSNKSVFQPWFGSSCEAEKVESVCKTIARTPRHVREATAEMGLWTSIEADVGYVDIPSLVVIGANDPVYGSAYQVTQMIPFLRRPETAMLDCGHFVPLERPEELARLISKFMIA